jgi:tetratricopeptide (TPR) repeat protein
MPLVKAQCENCNGILTVDSAKKAAICPYCGTPYVVQDAINHYSTHIANLHTDVLNVYTGDSKDNLLRKADTYLSLGQYRQAEETYEKITVLYPEEPRGWWGVYTSATENFSYFHDLVWAYEHYASTAMKLYDYSEEYQGIWKKLADKYSKELHLAKRPKNIWSVLSLKTVELLLFTSIDSTDNPYLEKMHVAACNNYYNDFKSGKTTFFNVGDTYSTTELWSGEEIYWPPTPLRPSKCTWYSERCILSEIPILQKIMDEGYQNAAQLPYNEYRNLDFLKAHVQYASKMYCGTGIGNTWAKCISSSSNKEMDDWAKNLSWDNLYKIVFLLGKTIVLENIAENPAWGHNEPCYQILILDRCFSPQEISDMEYSHWKKEGRCTYCGGSLSRGFFITKCDRCGKKKNY